MRLHSSSLSLRCGVVGGPHTATSGLWIQVAHKPEGVRTQGVRLNTVDYSSLRRFVVRFYLLAPEQPLQRGEADGCVVGRVHLLSSDRGSSRVLPPDARGDGASGPSALAAHRRTPRAPPRPPRCRGTPAPGRASPPAPVGHRWGRAVGRGRGSARARQCPRGSARARRYEAVAVATVTDEAAAARARRTAAFGKGGGRWQGRGQGRGQGGTTSSKQRTPSEARPPHACLHSHTV